MDADAILFLPNAWSKQRFQESIFWDGKLEQVDEDGQLQMVFQYDRQGNLVNEYHHDDVFGPTEARLRYVYDTAGEASFSSVYLGTELLMNQSSTFDQLGRVTQVSQSGGLVSSKRVALGYDSAGRLTQVNRYESGITSRYVGETDYTYDAIGRLSSIDHAKANGVVAASYDYTYDAANRLTQLQSLIDGVTTYTYDAIGQVTNTNAVNTSLDESFTYDATGNRVTGTVVGPDNELVSDANYNYQYDDEGRRTRRTAKTNNSYEVYTWDHRMQRKVPGIDCRCFCRRIRGRGGRG